jgi:drug/metabolite transporter (DMT)-like permease
MLSVIRIWLPVAIIVAGVVLVVARGGDETSWEGGAALWGAGLAVALLNWMYRFGVSGDRLRETHDALSGGRLRWAGRHPRLTRPRSRAML